MLWSGLVTGPMTAYFMKMPMLDITFRKQTNMVLRQEHIFSPELLVRMRQFRKLIFVLV